MQAFKATREELLSVIAETDQEVPGVEISGVEVYRLNYLDYGECFFVLPAVGEALILPIATQ